MGGPAKSARLRSLAAVLLAAGLLAVMASSASAAPAPGSALLSRAQVIRDRPLAIVANLASKPRVSVSAMQPQLASTATATGPLGLAWLIWAAAFMIFLGMTGLVVALLVPSYMSRGERRVESIERYVSAKPTAQDERSTITAISESLVNLGDKVMSKQTSTPHTQQLVERADLPLRLGEWAVLRLVAVVVGVSGGAFLLHGNPLSITVGMCLGAVVGFVLPILFLKFAASHRAKKFEAQLPDVLTLVASSLSTGFSLLQALDAVGKDSDEPAAKEFSRALAETRIGVELTESLAHLADRMDSQNMRWAGMAIDIQRQVGGNLAETLRTTASTLRDRQSLMRQVKALSAEGRLSSYILLALPVGLFFYMLGVNRHYVSLLWTTAIGMGMSGAGLISLAIGVFWMNKVVKVEV
jgi:tight adherence protein B